MLWDIDGTLVKSGEVGAAVFDRALESVLGNPPSERVRMSGKTDPQIVREYLDLAGVDDAGLIDRVLEQAACELASAADRLASEGSTCPGVEILLETFCTRAGLVQSILTGNIRPNAEVKLGAFGLQRFVDLEIGAFGSDHADRTKLVPIALQRAASRGLHFDPDAVWVIGDTPADLACARAGGVRCLLVATGRFSFDELDGLGADALLPDLSDTEQVVGLIESSR